MIKKDKAVELAQEYLELGFDMAVEVNKQFLPALITASQDVPFIKTLILALQMPSSVSDQILGTKILKFLYASELDEKKINKLRDSINNKKFEKVLKRVVLAIESHDDEEKSKITGKLFKALLDERITTKEFTSMVHATNMLNLDFLDSLKDHYMLNPSVMGGHRTLFVSLGLLNINESGIGTFGGGGPTYPLTSLGWKYLGIVLDHPETSIHGILMGIGELYPVVTDNGIRSSEALPMEVIISKKLRYERVDLFVVDGISKIGCKNGLPLCIGSYVPSIADSYDDAIHAILLEKGISIKLHYYSILAKFEDNIMVRTYVVVIDPTSLALEPLEYTEAKQNLFDKLGSIDNSLFDLVDNLIQYKFKNK